MSYHLFFRVLTTHVPFSSRKQRVKMSPNELMSYFAEKPLLPSSLPAVRFVMCFKSYTHRGTIEAITRLFSLFLSLFTSFYYPSFLSPPSLSLTLFFSPIFDRSLDDPRVCRSSSLSRMTRVAGAHRRAWDYNRLESFVQTSDKSFYNLFFLFFSSFCHFALCDNAFFSYLLLRTSE